MTTGTRPVALRLLLGMGLVVSTAGVAVTATEVPAYAAYADCKSPQRLCAWPDANANGAKFEWGGDWSGTCWNLIPSQNDRISSVYNRMSRKVTFYRDKNCAAPGGADWFTLDPGAAASVGQDPFPWYMNDAISSVYFH